ncbi:scaffold attachment factor B1-like [Palaemon carinicauda]|uniref:scaffold attachment factor B1-like n=1 Tax=Palaemon carinicauda TaxID=392227 RepID=UPI0035B622C1
MGEGAVGGVVSALGNGVIVEEKAKVINNGKGSNSDSNSNSDSEIEDKGIRHSKDEQKCHRKNEMKGKSDGEKEKKKCQDESKDDPEWVKVVSKKRARKSMIKDKRSMSVELYSLYSSGEVGNKKEGSSEDSSENERDVCKTVFMREVPRCERFNEHSSRDVKEFFKEYERLETLARKKYGDGGINENKELMKKFLATLPEIVAEFIHLKRTEKMRWTKERQA